VPTTNDPHLRTVSSGNQPRQVAPGRVYLRWFEAARMGGAREVEWSLDKVEWREQHVGA
jgi:hypothetical protein